MDNNLGNTIAKLRKEQNMTQQQLAEKLNITDKAVSKWERGLSYPDITSISKIAKILNVDSSYLVDLCKKENPYKQDNNHLIDAILIIIPFALSIALIVLNILNKITLEEKLNLVIVSILSISIYNLRKFHNKNT